MSLKRFFQLNPIHNTEYALEKRAGGLDWLFNGLQGLLDDLESIYLSSNTANITVRVTELMREAR
jgi:hypothetical protein